MRRPLTADAALSVSGNGVILQRAAGAAAPWGLDLQLGDYDFQAAVAAPVAQTGRQTERIAPPFRAVRIKVP